MYEAHFGLNKKPFQITSDPSFLWMGTKHREALTTLKYGVMDNKGFLLLTGDVGTGKTTVINRLLQDIKDKAYTAKIPDPRLTKYDFYRMVARYFKLPIEVRTKSDFIDPFTRFLNDAHHEKKSVLLVIDEAQRLKHDLMEEIRLLSNLERMDVKLLNIFFVGQNEFNGILLQPENRALMRRITMTYNIDPLNREETGAYIRHRLKVAGADYEIFSSEAVEEVYDFSNGFPRQINIISDLAMFFASQLDQRTIARKVVRQCGQRISFSITETPVKRARPAGEIDAAPPHPTRPARGATPPTVLFSRLWIGIGAALLLAIALGIYFTNHEWKVRARQWIQQLGPSAEESAAQHADAPSAMPAEAAGDPAGPDRATVVDPLPVPQPPPMLDARETTDGGITTPDVGDPHRPPPAPE